MSDTKAPTQRPLSPHLQIYKPMLTMMLSIVHRITGVALYVGDWATSQLWMFWVAPIVGAAIGAAIYRFLGGKED